jgi:hypothetical protein
MLAEGNSLRATSRMADVSINTVTKLLLDVGEACEQYQDKTLRGLKSKRIQCDEIWSFIYAKAKNVPESMKGAYGVGDVWTWVAIDSDTKLVPSETLPAFDVVFSRDGCARRFHLTRSASLICRALAVLKNVVVAGPPERAEGYSVRLMPKKSWSVK